MRQAPFSDHCRTTRGQGRQGGGVNDRGWQRRFDDPIPGRTLVSLRDAATYATELPKKEAALPEWLQLRR